MKNVTEDIYYVGVDDRKIDLFEGMYKVPEGVSYNSYIIVDEKIAVMDTVDAAFGEEWLKNVGEALRGRKPDYLVVQHMEPDHSACVQKFVEKYPEAAVVGNSKTFVMLSAYFGEDFPANRLVVSDGQELRLGKRTLKFVFAPMVHWPEVMFTYEPTGGTLFSADGFGKFGALNGNKEAWTDEARRYYIGIVGKYGVQVKGALGKLAGLDIARVAPLHGPVLKGESLSEAMRLYSLWSGYKAEERGVLIACASVYGHTRAAASELADELVKRGVAVKVMDLARDDWAECVAQAFRFSGLVIASPTYNADIFPAAREFIDRLTERNYKDRTVGFMENGSWAPLSAKLMMAKMEKCKDIVFAENSVKILSALNGESRAQIAALAEEMVLKVK